MKVSREEVVSMAGLELVILVGLPASGKSTFYRERLAATHVLVSKDRMPRSADKGKRQKKQIAVALSAGQAVCVDNTNVTREDRRLLLEQAREHGARVRCIWFDTAVDDAVRRNAGREGEARVPDVALYASAKRFERPLPGEGFDELWRAHLTERGVNLEREAPP